jgi:polysaccharide deacetylase family protein (PEP-CTERM system associated)
MITVTHVISVDVEDWYQTTIDVHAPLSRRFENSTRMVIEAFAEVDIKATFFVLGLAAEQAPHVVKAIDEAGHEVQSHGYGHELLSDITEEHFRQDLLKSKGLLEDLIGKEVFGYRAPSFSIDERTLWALDVLAETGYRYDSSIFPIKMSRYGMAGYPPELRIVKTPRGHRIIEAPIACFDWLGKRRPVGGGGYFRMWPYWVIRKAFRQMSRLGRAGIVYMHPYEYDTTELSQFKSTVSLKQRLHQGIGRKGFPRKVRKLIRDFPIGPFREVLADLLAGCSGQLRGRKDQ